MDSMDDFSLFQFNEIKFVRWNTLKRRTTHISVTDVKTSSPPSPSIFPQLFTKTRELLRPAGLDD